MIEKYSGNWDNLAGIRNDFAVSDDREDFPTDEEVIAAIYNYEDYSGDAFVLFKKDGKYYEVNSSHCSCNGLEGSWDPEETSLEALKMRQFGWGSPTGLKSIIEELIADEERSAVDDRPWPQTW